MARSQAGGDTGTVFFTNGDDFSNSVVDCSNGDIGGATFEKGVIAVDAAKVGTMWVQDED